ncbi:MAG: hypothetical protein ABR592_09700 [Nitriliruptorales bacterium]
MGMGCTHHEVARPLQVRKLRLVVHGQLFVDGQVLLPTWPARPERHASGVRVSARQGRLDAAVASWWHRQPWAALIRTVKLMRATCR